MLVSLLTLYSAPLLRIFRKKGKLPLRMRAQTWPVMPGTSDTLRDYMIEGLSRSSFLTGPDRKQGCGQDYIFYALRT